MKIIHILLLGTLTYDAAHASAANFMADRVLTKLSKWIKSEGSTWFTLPGYFKFEQVQSYNDEFTLAFTGPQLKETGNITRLGEARLDEGDFDPLYDTCQTLRFNASFQKITIDYGQVAFNTVNNGFFNLTSLATTDGISAVVIVDLKGHGDSCMAFIDTVDVDFNGNLVVSVNGSTADKKTAPVAEAVAAHFQKNVPKSVGTMLKTAEFGSLEYFDVCTGVNYPQTPPNVLADSVLNVVSQGLQSNISEWAVLPAFSKTGIVNDTTLDKINVDVGNFSSFGNIKRVGVASYENLVDTKQMNFNVSLEITNLTAVYGKIEYIDDTIWYPLAELVSAPKIVTTLTVTFTRKTPDSIPSCVGGSVAVTSKYVAGSLNFTNLTPGIPEYALRATNEVLGIGFRETVEGAVNDLFQNATKYALVKVCS